MSQRTNWPLFLFSRQCIQWVTFSAILTILPGFLLMVADAHELQNREAIDRLPFFDLDTNSIIQEREQEDRILQQSAFQAIDHHKTGYIQDISSPPGTEVQAIRLRTGRFRQMGLTLKGFTILPGCLVEPSTDRIILVYENLGHNASLFPVDGYKLVGPVVGIFAYDASNPYTTQYLPKLSVTAAPGTKISVRIPLFQPSTNLSPVCVYFSDVNASVVIRNLTAMGDCAQTQLGFVSLATKLQPAAPASTPATYPSRVPASTNSPTDPIMANSMTKKIAVGSAVGAASVLSFLSVFAVATMRSKRKKKLAVMESQSEEGESLDITLIGNMRAPMAGNTRTQPTTLEQDSTLYSL